MTTSNKVIVGLSLTTAVSITLAALLLFIVSTGAVIQPIPEQEPPPPMEPIAQGGLETFIRTPNPTNPGAPFTLPVIESDYKLTSPQGERISPLLGYLVHHAGTDMSLKVFAVWKAQVAPIGPGIVIDHYPPPGYYGGVYFAGDEILGGKIVIDHGDGFIATYGHMDETYVYIGKHVDPSRPIGRIGSTGLSTAAHLHLKLERYGVEVNPLLYIQFPAMENPQIDLKTIQFVP